MKSPPMICETCAYWRAPADGGIGQCRRYPPRLELDAAAYEFALSFADQWCGEYRPHGPTHQRFGKEGRND